MKKIFTVCSILSGLLFFAQEAGKAGEFLKNEASKREIESTTSKRQDSRNNNSDNSSGFRNSNNQNNTNRRPANPNYQWNNNYGYAEVFLRIPEQGNFSVELADQLISNNSGKYRFFDLPSGKIPISIYENGFLMYRTTLNVRNNSRLVLDFFTNEGLYLLDSYPLQNGYYGFNNWNDIWNNPYGNSGNIGNINYPNVMDNQTFQQFFSKMKEDAWFDDKKIIFINQQGRHAMFTSEQISVLVKDLSFDKNKIALAKSLFSKCVDKQKYFVVGDALDFESSRRDLMDFVSNY
ncbi:DUF4476 domain-containing protein [Chryseobacterium balustinum]|uniref:DUF4476 domain-containing protein n=1 Tax=Chryseobacterium balustinum TaxID=246 RepID=A0AAX2IG98_9FLAO|nr:DUF4476 domain-containing protein [Chryseobacterium balustinum]AZB28877.1 DUF4476 domain-containing protein [Chryseobacterium balustinum]SKB62935.1 protein of unknown function [Chryseobacterium balustinum]SQA87534.1 Uncharacterised protein [Chryseobacterium balustinum]